MRGHLSCEWLSHFMRYAYLALLLVGCGEIQPPDVNTFSIEWSAYLKKENGIICVVDANGYVIAIDIHANYPSDWESLEDFDKHRGPYTEAEEEVCFYN